MTVNKKTHQFITLFIGLFWSLISYSLSGQAYMNRFNTFLAWYQQLPFTPTPEFLEFVKGQTPLSNKLRDKWLYELARLKAWNEYVTYYQPTNDLNLVCYKNIALFNLGQHAKAVHESIPIWLSGTSQPKPCDALFNLLLQSTEFNERLITARIALALDKKNISLTRYLLKHYKKPLPHEADLLTTIAQNPLNITRLNPSEIHGYFYLYGLKRIVSNNMDKALMLWQQGVNKHILNEAQAQDFLAYITLYKALRNHEDTSLWFSKIKPQFYNEVLLDWQIRFALKNRAWGRVIKLINQSTNKNSPAWIYWLARAKEAQGHLDEAKALYEPLSKSRQYYGFLASIRLHKSPSFENETAMTDLGALKPYQPFINQIKSLYDSKQNAQASRLLNDFISELPKDEASALVYWIDSDLKWYGKSVYLSNNDLLNNQLSLRFPLAYQDSVRHYSKQYQVAPEFVYAIMRQESGFREDVVSSVGARGLMQVMPNTAHVVSKSEHIAFSDHKQLFLSQKNINIGVAYLKQLTKRFSNHPILIAAAYNAGPKQVVYWLKNHPPKEIDLWIETLPWQETRNYLKNIMAFSIVYQYRLKQKPNLNSFLAPI